MAVSAISGAAVPPTPQPRTESRVEGTTPDGDNDNDDVSQKNTVTQPSNTSQPTETLGNSINITV